MPALAWPARLIGPIRLPHAVDIADYAPPPPSLLSALRAWRLRHKRRRLLARAYFKRRDLTCLADRTARIGPKTILAFACIRDEAVRLPHFLAHHRALGVGHFLIVDNASSDGSRDLLLAAPDVSLWSTQASYRAARFGLDWLNHLLARYGHGHWCLTLDADELFHYPKCDSRDLAALTGALQAQGRESYGALMLDLYPKGRLGTQAYRPGDDPLAVLRWFDPEGYRIRVQPRLGNLWIQGGPRARKFFAETPERAPTLNKVPLVRWHWRYAYVNSTHSLLPRRLNDLHQRGNGLLLHTKFLPQVVERARIEKVRGEHFGLAHHYDGYYDGLVAGPDLWHDGAQRFENWRQAEAVGLISPGSWGENPVEFRGEPGNGKKS